jgi:hypothetical protein
VRPYLPASNDGHCVCVDVSRRLRIRNHPSDEWVYLQDKEREAAAGAVYVLVGALYIPSTQIAADSCNEAQSKNLRFSKKWAVFWWQRSRFNASPLPTRSWHGRQRSFTSTQLREPSLFTPMVRMDAAGRTHDVLS